MYSIKYSDTFLNTAAVGMLCLAAANPSLASARDLQCNQNQSRCVIEDRDLTIGDEVGVFTRNNELVAVGVVKGMRGHRRAVDITEINGTIRKGHRLALLDRSMDGGSDAVASKRGFRVWRDEALYTVGGSLGFASIGIGEGAPGTELSGFAAWRKFPGFEMVGRMTYLGMEGEVSRISGRVDGIETQPISMRGIGLLGGVGKTWMHNRPLSARAEAGVGFMHVGASVAGSSGDVEGAGYDTLVTNGFGKYLRGSASGIYNMQDWKLELGVAQTMFHDALSTSIGIGVMKDLR